MTVQRDHHVYRPSVCAWCGNPFMARKYDAVRASRFCSRTCCFAHIGHQSHTIGKFRSRFRSRWNKMIDRCTNPRAHNWKYYGGRGITVCPEWMESFEAFFSWVLTSGYSEGMTLDRREANGPYSPENCRWATQTQQCRNYRKRKNCSSQYKGVAWNTRDEKWQANIRIDGRLKFLGYFHSEEDAAKAYDDAAVIGFGEFARVNFPIDQPSRSGQ